MPKFILGFFVLLFLVGTGYFVATHNRTVTPRDTSVTPTMVTNPATKRGSLRALLGANESAQCTFTTTLPDGRTNVGTIYVANSRVKVDSVITDATEVQSLSFIDDGQHYYSWGNTADGAFAVKMNRAVATIDDRVTDSVRATEAPAESEVPFDYEQEMEYECTSWNVDESQFIPPNDIEFVDMSAIMETMMEGIGEFDPTMLEELEAMLSPQ